MNKFAGYVRVRRLARGQSGALRHRRRHGPRQPPRTSASDDKGAFSGQETITNNTGPTLTPEDGQSETVTGYTDDVLGIGLDMTYTLPNGEYALFQTFVSALATTRRRDDGWGYDQMSGDILPVVPTQDKNSPDTVR